MKTAIQTIVFLMVAFAIGFNLHAVPILGVLLAENREGLTNTFFVIVVVYGLWKLYLYLSKHDNGNGK